MNDECELRDLQSHGDEVKGKKFHLLSQISAKTAYNMRFERGLLLPTYREYEVEELATIAIRQAEIMDEMAALDKRILEIACGGETLWLFLGTC